MPAHELRFVETRTLAAKALIYLRFVETRTSAAIDKKRILTANQPGASARTCAWPFLPLRFAKGSAHELRFVETRTLAAK